MSTSKIVKGVAPVVGAVAMAGAAVAGPAAADTPTHAPALDTVTTHAAPAVTPVPPGSPGDENGNGLLDSSEMPDNPDLPPSFQPPGSPGDENGNGQLDSSETPDNPDVPPRFLTPGAPGDDNGNGQLDSSETPDNPDQS